MKKKISYAEHKHKMEACDCDEYKGKNNPFYKSASGGNGSSNKDRVCTSASKDLSQHLPNCELQKKVEYAVNMTKDNYMCQCKKDNKKAGKNIYSCYLCQKPPKKSKYHYWETYLIFRQKCQAHSEVPEKEIFQKFMVENLKEAKND